MKLQFIGAAREVTGSKHLLTTAHGKKILLDCGMFQGKGLETEKMNRELAFDPAEINHIILTHAHIDHSGLIPYLYKKGFRGSVICTNATRDLSALMLADSGHIHESDTRTFNKKRVRQGLEPVEPIYTRKEAVECMKLFIGVAYDRKFNIDDKIRVVFSNTGHMLGSAVANIEITEGTQKKKLAYTGDIGRPVNRILRHPDPFPQTEYLITESTYGDRIHKDTNEAEDELIKIITETCINKGGKLIIPSFAVGRTQEIVYSLNNFYNERRLPRIEIFVDSPLAVDVTEVFRTHAECFNEEIMEVLHTDPDPFGFGTLHYIKDQAESKRLNTYSKPCVIISSSGMMEAGRVKHHLANNISDSRNTILAVGYCAPNTLGAKILRGDQEVSIHGNPYPVRASVMKLESFSGHGDYKEMMHFLKCQDTSQLKKTFIVHGEYEVQKKYAETLGYAGFSNIEIPAKGDEFEL